MRPVSDKFTESQGFASMATEGVAANSDPNSGTGYYVYLYGNYQPYGHAGMDIACPTGTPVHAMASGTVLWADWGTNLPGDESDWGYRQRLYLYKGFPGIVTVIQHPWGKGVYAHKSEAWMNIGDTVREGQQIGLSGGTGGVAPHLHVEALVDDSYSTGNGLIYGRTDPTKYFGTTTTTSKGLFVTLTPAQEKLILDRITRYVDSPVSAVPAKVWQETVLRGGQQVSVKQELADSKTEVRALRAVVEALAKNPDLTAEQITAAIRAGIADGTVTVDVKVNGAVK